MFFYYTPFVNSSGYNFELKIGGWSYHSKESNYNYNEVHNGLGLEFYKIKDKHNFGIGYWEMDDSFSVRSQHYGFNYRYNIDINKYKIKNINPTLSFMVANRGWLYFDSDGSTTIEKHKKFLIVPSLNVNINDFFGFDFFFIPKTKSTFVKRTFFIRLSFILNKF